MLFRSPEDHPLVIAIKNLKPDSDECLDTDELTDIEIQTLCRRLKEVLPYGRKLSFRTIGPRQGWGSYKGKARNKIPKKRTFWVVTKKDQLTKDLPMLDNAFANEFQVKNNQVSLIRSFKE